ncbi:MULTISPECIES: DUF2142 domain-containing protein [Enorma]|uniref:DUF2142 domain-containing protein n=1 Tax=Enorma TaxID=1472762 RepID=UPI0008FF036C
MLLAGFCVVFSFAFPPMSVPDETHHYLASYWLADCLQGESSFNNSESFPVRLDDWQMVSEWSSNAISHDSFKNIATYFQFTSSTTSIHEVSGFSFSIGGGVVVKIPTVLAILAGKAMHLGPYPIFYIGRILNSALFIVLAVAAYRNMPHAKNVITYVSLLPMTLHLAASYSYDSGIIGLSLLLFPLFCRLIESKDKLSRREVASITICATCLAPCKLIYISVCLFAFIIPINRFGSRKTKLHFFCSCLYLLLHQLYCCACLALFLWPLYLAASTIGESKRGRFIPCLTCCKIR